MSSDSRRVVGERTLTRSRPMSDSRPPTVREGVQAAVAQLEIISGRRVSVLLPDGKYAEPEIEYFLISPDVESFSSILPR